MKNYTLERKLFLIIATDILIIAFSHYLSYGLRFGFDIPEPYLQIFFKSLPLFISFTVAVFFPFNLYSDLWRYSGMKCMQSIVSAITISLGLVLGFLTLLFHGDSRSLWPIFLMNWFVSIILIGGFRFHVRILRDLGQSLFGKFNRGRRYGKRVMIVGAGDAGEMILREMRQNPGLGYIPVCFIDDNPEKKNRTIHGIAVVGTQEDIPRIVMKRGIDEIIITIPSASGKQISRIVEQCRRANVEFKTVPAVAELINGCIVGVKQIREVRIEDILGREPVRLNVRTAKRTFSRKNVLITGAGGSIGSEIARQISRFKPKEIILYEREESNLFHTHQELLSLVKDIDVIPVVGDILHEERLDEVMRRHEPYAVFHAAAYKHVPMMEENPFEAVQNNIFGSLTIARKSAEHKVRRFIFISTDKAVRPTSIMGASKRAAEKAVLSLEAGTTSFTVVRFGNVLASRGSVVSIFEKQIARGGPVTVTHPDATRYFMTIPEAVQLVLVASSIGNGREIFTLDMGEPVRIMDLAESMIRLSGLEPGRDIQIKLTGLRPGEKLSEEILANGETAVPTEFEKVISIQYDPHLYGRELLSEIEGLRMLTEARDKRAIMRRLQEIIDDHIPETFPFPTKDEGGVRLGLG